VGLALAGLVASAGGVVGLAGEGAASGFLATYAPRQGPQIVLALSSPRFILRMPKAATGFIRPHFVQG
jgi:hypothetical protein